MKLSEFDRTDVLTRPVSNKKTIMEGAYNGETISAVLVEKESQFSADGFRVVLIIKVEVQDQDDETVELYSSSNFSWSKRGRMLKVLEKLEALPDQGESINLEELEGIPVQVIVENIEKDGEIYSNIVSMKKIKQKKKKAKKAKSNFIRTRAAKVYSEEIDDDIDIDDIEDDYEDDYHENYDVLDDL